MTQEQYMKKLRTRCASLDKKIEKLSQPRLENTPKRQLQGMRQRIEMHNLCNERDTIAKLISSILSEVTPNLFIGTPIEDIGAYTRKCVEHPSYYVAYLSDAYENNSEKAVSFRSFIAENSKSLSDEEVANRERARKIQRMEEDLRFTPIPGFFPTPPSLIEQLIDLADIQRGHKVMEPSAGKGDLAIAAMEMGGMVKVVEIVPTLFRLLELKGFDGYNNDFMTLIAQPIFDRVVMNPPFEKLQDISHIRLAYDWLAPSGRLVSVVSPSFEYNISAQWFRDWLATLPHEVQKIEPGAFKGKDVFRETGVACCLIVIDKPIS